jgi:ubiquinone/menaquinone biosynthesis C-methylase UbiE
MSEIPSSGGTYALEHTPREIRRLLVQGQLLNTFTRRLLENAGLTTGMKVLDVGCGPGDVSLLAAELVGKTGSVLGVDSNASVLQVAQARARQASLTHVLFLAADIHDLALDRQYDAIVGRLVLEPLPERTAPSDRLIHHVRPGGVVAFQEYDLVGFADAALPSSSLWEQACYWVTQVFQQVGVELRMGCSSTAHFWRSVCLLQSSATRRPLVPG